MMIEARHDGSRWLDKRSLQKRSVSKMNTWPHFHAEGAQGFAKLSVLLPGCSRKASHPKILDGIGADFLQDDLSDSSILSELATWIESYLVHTEEYSDQWWELYLEEREFWDAFPALPEALLRRGFVGPPLLF